MDYVFVQCLVILNFTSTYITLYLEPLKSTCNGQPPLLGIVMSTEH